MKNDYMFEALRQRGAREAMKVIVDGQKKERGKKDRQRRWRIEVRQRRKKGTL